VERHIQSLPSFAEEGWLEDTGRENYLIAISMTNPRNEDPDTRTSFAGGLKYALTMEGYISHDF
jgi:hypothetical protein